jgi:hypothetical protein
MIVQGTLGLRDHHLLYVENLALLVYAPKEILSFRLISFS